MSRPTREKQLESSLSINEIAQVLNTSRPVVYRLMRDDPDFRTFKVGARTRMRRSVLDKWIKQREEKEQAS